MYQFNEDENQHATMLYHILDGAIQNINSDVLKARRHLAKIYADTRFNWINKSQEWYHLLNAITILDQDKKLPAEQYVYRA